MKNRLTTTVDREEGLKIDINPILWHTLVCADFI